MFEATGKLYPTELNSYTASDTSGNFGSAVTDYKPINLPLGWFDNTDYVLKFGGPVVTSEKYFYTDANEIPIAPDYTSYENDSQGGFFDANRRVVSMMTDRHDQIRSARFTHDKYFGVWNMHSWGVYDHEATASTFVLSSDQYLPNDITTHPSTNLQRIYSVFSLGTWADGKLSGNAYGIIANWFLGGTGVMVGETLGVYNDDDGGFGAFTGGSWVATSKFLDSTWTSKLTSLGFPTTVVAQNIMVEKSSSGYPTTNNPYAKMESIKVFSGSLANMQYVWATNALSGHYNVTSIPPPNNDLNHMYGVLMKNAGETLYARFEMLRADVVTPGEAGPLYDPSDNNNHWIGEIYGMGAIQTTSGSWIQGDFWGEAAGRYTEASSDYTFSGNAAGFLSPSTVGEILPDATGDKYHSYLRTYNGTSFEHPGFFKGMMKLGDYVFPIWMATTEDMKMKFDAMGYYSGNVIPTWLNSANYLFITPISPWNYTVTPQNSTTIDGSSYAGWVAGIYRPYGSYYGGNNIEGWTAGLYIGQNGSTKIPGLFMGRFGDDVDPVTGNSSSWVSDRAEWGIGGKFIALDLGATTSVAPANLNSHISDNSLAPFYLSSSSTGIVYDGSGNATLSLASASTDPRHITLYWISDVPWAGVWKTKFFGTISKDIWSPTPLTTTGWNFELNADEGLPSTQDVGAIIAGDKIGTVANYWDPTYGDRYNKMTGDIAGYWADIATITRESYTGLMFGKVTGTFNPGSLTYQAAALGVWFETKQFLAMAADMTPGGGNDKLLQLGIPAVNVGTVDLAQYTETSKINSMAMNEVKFFAPTMGGKPQVWATGSVSGNWTATPPTNHYVGLQNSTFDIKLDTYVKSWSGSKWLATANGTASSGNPVYSSGFTMKGAAAGTYTGTSSGTFTGTAAGHAK
jgi:hypothetical protein